MVGVWYVFFHRQTSPSFSMAQPVLCFSQCSRATRAPRMPSSSHINCPVQSLGSTVRSLGKRICDGRGRQTNECHRTKESRVPCAWAVVFVRETTSKADARCRVPDALALDRSTRWLVEDAPQRPHVRGLPIPPALDETPFLLWTAGVGAGKSSRP